MTLTDAIRAYLAAARAGRYLFVDVVADLTTRFGLSAQEAGLILAQDLQEQA